MSMLLCVVTAPGGDGRDATCPHVLCEEQKQVGGPVNCSDSELSNYLRALAEGFLATYYSDTSPSVQSKSMSIASKSYQRGKKMVVFHGFPSFQMSRNLTENPGGGSSMSSLAASRARTSPAPDAAPGSAAPAPACGRRWRESWARYDRATSSWRTHRCLFDEALPSSSLTLPSWGMTLGGVCWEPRTRALPTSAGGSGSWLPTPSASDYGSNRGGSSGRAGRARPSLGSMARSGMWPTPRASEAGSYQTSRGKKFLTLTGAVKTWSTPTARLGGLRGMPTADAARRRRAKGKRNLEEDVAIEAEVQDRGPLNPAWVEWLMGFPIGWTGCAAVGTRRFRLWLRSHGAL